MSPPMGISSEDWAKIRAEVSSYPLPDPETLDRLARLFGGTARQDDAARDDYGPGSTASR